MTVHAKTLRVMVTGASGNLGAEIVARLCSDGHSVVALMHTAGDIVRNDESVLSTTPYTGHYPDSAQVAVLHGDVTQANLGMERATYRALQTQTDVVVHSAAMTSFGKPWNVYESINIHGTRHVIAFAKGGGQSDSSALLYISTMYVCGERPGVFCETDLERKQSFGSPYEQSKFEAEKLVRSAMADGLAACICRPSIIVGHSRTGAIRKFDTIYTVYRLTTAGLVRTIPGDYGATLDIVPIDWVADGVNAALNGLDKATGKTLHLCSAQPLALRDINDVCAEFPAFNVPRFVPGHIFEHCPREPLEKRYYEQVVGLYESYFRRQVKFIRSATQRVFANEPASVNKELLRRCFSHAQDVGYFRRRPGTV